MLSRLALRLAAVEALAPVAFADSGPWPTIAGPRVYDSRQDPIDALDEIEGRPILIVYTEQGNTDPYPKDRKVTGSADHEIELTIEAMIAAKGIVVFELPDGGEIEQGTLEAPIMEREHEALLDLLEATVRRRLEGTIDAADPAVALFRRCAWEIRHVNTVPLRDATKTVRLAARTIVLKVKIPGDAWAPAAFDYVAPVDVLDRLPEPLRTVAHYMPDGSSGAAICARVAELIADPAAITRLDRIDLNAAIDRGVTPPLPVDVTGQVQP